MKKQILFFLLLFMAFSASAQLKFSNPDLKEYDTWISMRNNNLYSDNTFKNKIGIVERDEKFKILDSYYLLYDFMVAKITGIAKNNFNECKSQGFKIGDNIKLVAGLGESQWAVVHGGKLKYASFNFDYDNDKLTRSAYDGCNVITGNIIKSTEKRHFIVKVRTQSGRTGYIRFISDGNYQNEFSDFIQSY